MFLLLRLEIQLVSAARAVLYVLRTDIQNEKSAHLSANILEMLQEAKGAVVSALRAKMNEGAKKGAKGAPAPADDVPVDESLVTESFCRTLPPLVSRQCVAFQLKLDPLCSRKGFVLDAWDDCIVSGAESLQEIMMNAFGDHEPLEPSDGDGSGSEVAAGPAPRRIDFVLELQVRKL